MRNLLILLLFIGLAACSKSIVQQPATQVVEITQNFCTTYQPPTGTQFYVSDSYTLLLTEPGPQYHFPGAANGGLDFYAGDTVSVFVQSASFQLVQMNSNNDEINIDVRIALYRDDAPAGVAVAEMPYIGRTDGHPAMVLNQTSTGHISEQEVRCFGNAPLQFQYQIPADWPGRYKVGASVQLHVAQPTKSQYSYYVLGYVTK